MQNDLKVLEISDIDAYCVVNNIDKTHSELRLIGAYGFKRHTDGTANIVCYDFGSLELTYMGKVDSFKDSSGFIEDAAGGICPIVAGDHLYLIKSGVIDYGMENNTSSFISRMNPDGSGKITITLGAAQSFDLTCGIAFDGSELYFLRYNANTKTGVFESVSLCRTNFDKRTIEELEQFDAFDKTRNFIFGTYEDGLVFLKMSLDGDYELQPDGSVLDLNKLVYDIVLYDINADKFINTEIKWRQNELTATIYENKIFILDSNNKLTSLDLSTEESKEYCLDCSSYGSNIEPYLAGNVIDNHLMLKLYDEKDNVVNAGFDLDTQKITVVDITYLDSDGVEFGIAVLAETKDCLVVICGAEYRETKAYLEDGTPYTYDARIEKIGLLTKEDYWNSSPNLITFKDYVND